MTIDELIAPVPIREHLSSSRCTVARSVPPRLLRDGHLRSEIFKEKEDVTLCGNEV